MRIAIIEDSRLMITIWEQNLACTNHEMVIFTSTASDLTRVAVFRPDVIIFGIAPAETTTDSLLIYLRSHPGLRNSYLLLATSFSTAKLHGRINFELIDGVLVKPLQSEQLIAKLDGLMARKARENRQKPLAVLVDDSETARTYLSRELEALGFDVKQARDGQEGLELVSIALPDLVLADMEMPRLSGLQMCVGLSENPRTNRIPIIIVSAVVDQRIIRQGFASGATSFVPKPVDPSRLAHAVGSVLGERARGRKYRQQALIVEDSPMIAAILARTFESLGVVPTICCNVKEFDSYRSVISPDIISTDLNLPDGDGVELVRRVRQDHALDTVPMVVISGIRHRETAIECLREGANDFIEKPFVREELVARVTNLLKIRSLQDQMAQKNRMLERLAYHDGLTGLFNRAYFDICLQQELRIARQSKLSMALLIIDLDHFKKVNDCHGHEVGDEVLKEVSETVSRNVRPQDIACRYGGEELAVILPHSPRAGAISVAERIRSACDVTHYSRHGLHQTMSIGISVFPDISCGEALVKDADRALYSAKHGGRNRIVVA